MAKQLTDELIAEYKEAFDVYDKNGDGTITTSELGAVMISLGNQPTEGQLQSMIQQVDANKNGTIDFEEFVNLMLQDISGLSEHDELLQTFKQFDKDGNGMISREELWAVMANFGEHLTNDELTEMIQVADVNNDGQINYEEFVKMLRPEGSIS